MSYVEIPLKNRNVVTADVSGFTIQKNALGSFAGIKWTTPENAKRRLLHLDVDEIAAIVFVDSDEDEKNATN
jgi:hypothetical protein